MIYGKLIYHVDDDSTDKIGMRTIVLGKMWQASRAELTIEERDAEIPPPPEMAAGLLLVGRQTRRLGGAVRTQWTFDGIDGDGKSVTFRTRTNTIDYGFDPGFSQVPIQLHPKIQSLLDGYGGQQTPEGDIFWPATLSSADGNGSFSNLGNELFSTNGFTGLTSTGLSGGAARERPNPMFGIKDFLRIEGTYWCRYADFNPPTTQSGQIFQASALPGRAPNFPGRDYLSAGAPFRRRGPVHDITEMYWLSGPGGWPKPVYGIGSQK